MTLHQPKISDCNPQKPPKNKTLQTANSLKYQIASRKNHQKIRLCKPQPQTTKKNDSASQTA
jgi:hypothetical protein